MNIVVGALHALDGTLGANIEPVALDFFRATLVARLRDPLAVQILLHGDEKEVWSQSLTSDITLETHLRLKYFSSAQQGLISGFDLLIGQRPRGPDEASER